MRQAPGLGFYNWQGAMKSFCAVVTIIAVVPLVSVACSSNEGNRDAADIDATVRGFYAAWNAEQYDQCMTYCVDPSDAFVRQTIELMRHFRLVSGGPVEVETIDVTVDGQKAEARVSGVSGEQHALNLTKLSGTWKINFGEEGHWPV